MPSPKTLQRGLKQRHISLIALGGTIGASYFLGTGYIVNQVGPAAFLAYALGGIIVFLTMACFAELIVSIPRSGYFISYAKTYISPSWASGVGWSYWISWVICIPSECIAAGILTHQFFPDIPAYVWTVCFGFLITFVNLIHVKAFGEMEFWLSLIKIGLIFVFCIFAILVFFGVIGSNQPQIIGAQYLLGNGGLFPNGFLIFFITMVVLLNNLQGAEIVGITASEAQDPEKTVPDALKKISYRLILLYLIPTFLLVLILPWQKTNLAQSAFGLAFSSYGFAKVGHVFNFLIVAASLSFANSGMYSTARSLYSLSLRGMAPKSFRELNSDGVPVKATIVSLTVIWLMIIFSCFFPLHDLYAILLASSGFTGSICWISICWSQYSFRKKWIKNEGEKKPIKCRVVGFPYLTQFAIWLQVFCLLVVLISPSLRIAFYVGAPAIIFPIAIYKYLKYRIKKNLDMQNRDD